MLPFQMLFLENIPIFEQLKIEEALLRTDQRNWCVINHGSSDAIVMGISGQPEKLIHLDKKASIPIIKRFSGGGTVIVDANTIFVTLIVNQEILPEGKDPKKLLEWTQTLYAPLFGKHPFAVRENDYVFGQKKFGGNAQYIQKGRFLHHSSLLWSFDQDKMDLLKLPERRPNYRQSRPHKEFLTTLNQLFSCKETFIQQLKEHFKECLNAQENTLEHVLPLLKRPHRKGTLLVEPALFG